MRPLIFTIRQRTNEPFEITLPFKWVASQWPLPDGSYFQSDIRTARDAVAEVMTFSSNSNPNNLSPSPMTMLWDGAKTMLFLALFAPQGVVASLARPSPYVMDIRLVRPRAGGLADRVDIIAEGTVKIIEGVTR